MAALDARGIHGVWKRMALPCARPRLWEPVGAEVMLCRALVRGSALEDLTTCSQLLPSLGGCCCCCCWHLSFPDAFSILLRVSGLCVLAAAMCWPAVSQRLSLLSWEGCRTSILSLKLGDYGFKWSPCILRTSDKELCHLHGASMNPGKAIIPQSDDLLSA